MSRAVDAFLDEIRRAPEFVSACERSAHWREKLEQLDSLAETLCRSDDPLAIEASDRIAIAVADRSHTIKQRLMELREILIGVIDGLRAH